MKTTITYSNSGKRGAPLFCILLLSFFLTLINTAWAAPAERFTSGDSLTAIIPADGPPSFYRDKKTGEAAGFFVDITNAVAKRAGFSVTYIFGDNWEEIRDSIQSGHADICPGLAVSPDREQFYSFTQPFDIFLLTVFARAESGLSELKQGSVVGVLRGSVAYELLRTMPGVQVIAYDNFEIGLFELLAGKIDAFAGPAPVLLRLAREAGVEDHIEIVGKPLAEVKRAFGMKKGRTELTARLNKALDGFIASPEYNALFAKWYGKPRPHFALSSKTMWIMVAFSLLIIGLATWRHMSIMALTRRFGKEVEERKKAEASLKESEALYRELFEAESDAIVLVDNETGRIIEANGAAAALYGFERTELLTKKNTDLSAEPDVTRQVTQQASLNPGEIMKIPQRLHRNKDGVVFPVEITGRLFTLFGRSVHIAAIRDITERRQAENALRRSESLYHDLVETSQDLIWQCDAEGRYTYLNPAWETVIGYRVDEMLGKKFTEFQTPEDAEKDLKEFARLMGGGMVKGLECTHIRKNGTPVHLVFNAKYVANEQELIIGTRGTAYDITDRKRWEKEREQFFRFFQTSTDIMVIADPNGAFLKTNPACTELLGYSAEELVAKPFVDFIHTEDKQPTLDEMARQQKIGFSLNFENRYLCKDGSFKWLSWRATFVKEEGITYATARDITERKRSDKALQESEILFRTLSSLVPVGIYLADTKGACLYANERWCEMAGMTENEALGMNWGKGLHPSDRELVFSKWQQMVDSKGTWGLEYRFLRPDDGKVTWVYGLAVPLHDESGKITKYIGANSDITERKNAEEQLKRNLKEKEVLLQEIHHRVKNNMQVISSLLNLQAREIADESVRAMFAEARNRVHSMAMIHERLYGSVDLAHVDFKEYLDGLISSIADTYKRRDVVMTVDMEPLALDVNVGIPCGLIVNELVSNSLKHAFPEGRTGRISAGISRNSEGNNVLIVADNGIGFPESKDFLATTSLGLRLVNVLTEQIHGTIELERDGGTRVRITFPGT